MPDFSNQYSVYGIAISSSTQLPLLARTSDSESSELRIVFGELPFKKDFTPSEKPLYTSKLQNERGIPRLTIQALPECGYYYLEYSDDTRFFLDFEATEIWATWESPLTIEDALTYLLGPVLGFALHLRGIVSLHGSAVVMNGHAIGFVGDSGAGKSTLAAAFVQTGLPALTDDVLALEASQNGFLAHNGYPRLRLWPDSVEMLFGSTGHLPRITPNWNKRHLELDAEQGFFIRKAPLSAIYFLDPSEKTRGVEIEHVAAKPAFFLFLENNYVTTYLNSAMPSREFEFFTGLARTLLVGRVHWNPSEGPNPVRDAIQRDLQRNFQKSVLTPLTIH